MNMARRAKQVRRGPTGRENVVGTQSPDSATLHPGLFSLLPSGKRAGASAFRQAKEPASTAMNIYAVARLVIHGWHRNSVQRLPARAAAFVRALHIAHRAAVHCRLFPDVRR